MRVLLTAIHEHSASAGRATLPARSMEQHEETFSGVYGNANRDARWLSTMAYADLVSGGADGARPSYAPMTSCAVVSRFFCRSRSPCC